MRGRNVGACAAAALLLLCLPYLLAAPPQRVPLPADATEIPAQTLPVNPVLLAAVVTGVLALLGGIGFLVRRGARAPASPSASGSGMEPALRGGRGNTDSGEPR